MRDEVTMTDRKPYLLRAIYQWIVDNDCTPHLVSRRARCGLGTRCAAASLARRNAGIEHLANGDCQPFH